MLSVRSRSGVIYVWRRYDRPSDLFGQFGDERVTRVAKRLDQQIHNLLIAAAT